MSLSPEEFTFPLQDKVIELIKACERATEQGLERMLLVKKWKQEPRGSWDRKRVMPGVYGRIIGSTTPGNYLVDVAVADVVAMLEKVMRVK